MQRVQLQTDGALHVLGRHPRQRQVPHDHLAPRQQHGGAQVAHAQRFQPGPVLGAPFRRRPRGEIFHGQPSRHPNPRHPGPHYHHLQIALANLDSHARAERQQFPQILAQRALASPRRADRRPRLRLGLSGHWRNRSRRYRTSARRERARRSPAACISPSRPPFAAHPNIGRRPGAAAPWRAW